MPDRVTHGNLQSCKLFPTGNVYSGTKQGLSFGFEHWKRKCADTMKTKRDEDNEESEAKRQKLHQESSLSPPSVIDNPLLPLASYDDDDDDEEEEEERRGRNNDRDERKGGRMEENGHREEEEDEEDGYSDRDQEMNQGRRNRQVEIRRDCPYLDTVNRQVLDFDFEKFCSVSLSNLNVYACLVCGKYFQGRGRKSHAYTHSLEAGHHVYVNLQTEKVYCLPDGYEINDPSLDDIRHVLNPRFSREQVAHLDKNKQWSRALDGSDYLPGMVGLNNIKETDFVNVIIQSLMRVTPLRNFFLIPENYQNCKSPLVHRFGELTRKIWHARNFKGQVSPHEFLQAVMKASKKRFRIGAQSDPVEFMSWLLNTLHADLRKKNTSIIYKCFQGELEVVKEIHNKSSIEKKENGDDQNNGVVADGGAERANVVMETSRMPFLMLGLDLPPPPLFKDVMEKNIIPQVPLFNILKKFDGESVTEVVRPCIARMRYRVTKLPQYLILHMRRFTKNNFFVEKNPTLVNFPVKNLELKDYIPLPTPKENEKLRSKYDLIANIVHDGKPGEGFYRVFVQRKSEELWYEMQDLHVAETLPQMVALSETYMQIYEQQQQQ
ncbi:Ubiquitin carboxyl-terminal hydrolases family 2 [Macleaya cordata]|uniref:Ubiquitin carboxyl-terminal hydrolases family 2 n=1 Tax=Macleaya cordata TaxID=56857 RepID=A0A200PN25_MACCD|nr:Ubiquitin carboxyl-terminal hydrolases family 2 [Macleaya cordata]